MMQFLPQNKKDNNAANRLCIYFFYDKDGIVDDYVAYYLEKMRNFCREICVVVNGNLTGESKQKLLSLCNKLIIRENSGFDAWAYKEALYSYGLENIANVFNEVLFNNFTCFGPIGSFEPMFSKMENSVCDFWGHCRYYPSRGQKVGGQPIPEHLMSYFIVFRKNILTSEYFSRYWETLKPINNYDDARLNHEFRLTPYFERLGFISDAYVNQEKCYRLSGTNTTVFNAFDQIVKDDSPLLKRKALFIKNGKSVFSVKFSQTALLNYIMSQNLYDVKLCLDNLIRTGDLQPSPKVVTKITYLRYFVFGRFLHIKKYKRKYEIIKYGINSQQLEQLKNSL